MQGSVNIINTARLLKAVGVYWTPLGKEKIKKILVSAYRRQENGYLLLVVVLSHQSHAADLQRARVQRPAPGLLQKE